MKCDGNCWGCTYEGCINLTTKDLVRQDEFDREEKKERKPVNETATWRYNHSDKAKACKKRYLQTERGRMLNNKNSKNQYRKNREHYNTYRKMWYRENKERISEKRKVQYRENREEILNKTRKYKAFMGWRKRFIARNNREPMLDDVYVWEVNYIDKRMRKEKRDA